MAGKSNICGCYGLDCSPINLASHYPTTEVHTRLKIPAETCTIHSIEIKDFVDVTTCEFIYSSRKLSVPEGYYLFLSQARHVLCSEIHF